LSDKHPFRVETIAQERDNDSWSARYTHEHRTLIPPHYGGAEDDWHRHRILGKGELDKPFTITVATPPQGA
jgi:hypothetical protein